MRSLATHSGVTAEEILYALNRCQTVPLNHMDFLVVTGTHTPHRDEPQAWPFTPGEIVPVHHDGDDVREFLGQGRDPYTDWEDSSWCTYHCDILGDALQVAELVTSDRPRGYYEWTDDGLSYMSDQGAAHEQWAGAPDWYVRIGDHTGRAARAELRSRLGAKK